MIGMIINALIKNKPDYVNLSNLNFIENNALTKIFGLGIFKWIVKNTFFKYLNIEFISIFITTAKQKTN